jgi:hypothetical protein
MMLKNNIAVLGLVVSVAVISGCSDNHASTTSGGAAAAADSAVSEESADETFAPGETEEPTNDPVVDIVDEDQKLASVDPATCNDYVVVAGQRMDMASDHQMTLVAGAFISIEGADKVTSSTLTVIKRGNRVWEIPSYSGEAGEVVVEVDGDCGRYRSVVAFEGADRSFTATQ